MVVFAESTLRPNVGLRFFLQSRNLIQVTKIDEAVCTVLKFMNLKRKPTSSSR